MNGTNSSSVKFISFILGLIPFSIFGLMGLTAIGSGNDAAGVFFFVVGFIAAWIVGSVVRMNNEWEEAVILRLGEYQRTVGSGLFYLVPFLETAITRDTRIMTLDIPRQEVITKDNISVGVDAVVFLRIVNSAKSVINIQNYLYAVKQYAQTTLRNVIGQRDLDQLLEKRKDIARMVKKSVDVESDKWGIDVTSIELQNIELPKNMKRVMARQAEAEREKRAVIIKSKGEVEAARSLKEAADILMESRGHIAVKLREYETLSDISYDQSNTIVFYPTELGSKEGLNTLLAGTALSGPTKYKKDELAE